MLTRVTKARAKVGDPGDAGAGRTIRRRSRSSSRRRASSPPRCRGCWSWRRTTRSSSRTPIPRPAGAARGHREPHHRRAQPLHQGGAGVQHHRALVPDQPDRDAVRLQGEAELHGRGREGDREAAEGRLRRGRTGSGSRAAVVARASARRGRWALARAALAAAAGRRGRAEVAASRRSRRASPISPARSPPPARARSRRKLAAFEARKGSQVAVLMVPTTQPEAIEQFAIRVADAWKLGRKGGGRRRAPDRRQEGPQGAHRGRATGSKARCPTRSPSASSRR